MVVKVQRRDPPRGERDLDIVFELARTIEARLRRGSNPHGTIHTPTRRGLAVVELADGFAAALGEELDFRVEARNMAETPSRPLSVRLPALHAELSSERVLVLDRLDGIPLDAASSAIDERGADRTALARSLLECLLARSRSTGSSTPTRTPGTSCSFTTADSD